MFRSKQSPNGFGDVAAFTGAYTVPIICELAGGPFSVQDLNIDNNQNISCVKSSLSFVNFMIGGKVKINVTNTNGDGAHVIASNVSMFASLDLTQESTGGLLISGVISGSNSNVFTKLGTGILTLTGANTYSGGTTLTAGTLTGNTVSLQGAIATSPSTTLRFDQTLATPLASTTFGGTITGSGDLIINQPAQPLSTFTNAIGTAGDMNVTGATVYNAANASQVAEFVGGTLPASSLDSFVQFNGLSTSPGVLTVTNAMANFGTVNITTELSLQQGSAGMAGTVGPTTNNGILTPGNSIGILNIVGNYTQTAGGTLIIELNDAGASDQLLITGTANLDGAIFIAPEPGLYFAGDTYTFMTYAARVGTFAQILEEELFDYTVIYNPLNAQIVVQFSGAVTPIPISDLKGNERAVGEYLFCDNLLPSDPDLLSVMNLLVHLPADIFGRELVQLSPGQFGALPLAQLQSQRLVADNIAESAEKYHWCDGEDSESNRKTSVWVAPIGHYYDQERVDGQIAFDAHAVGVTAGANHLFAHNILVGGGVGYTHSHIDWDERAGDGRWNSVYFGPSVGWMPGNAFVNLLVLGAYNQYNIDRTIRFPGLSRTAHNNHHSWDVMARADGGYRFRINTGGKIDHFYILPEARLSYLNIFESSYTESGAASLNLKVDSKYSAFLQPNVMVKFLRDFHAKKVCITPVVQIGWISTIPLTSSNYTSNLFKQMVCKSNFTVTSFHDTTHQLSLGGELVFRTESDLILVLGYSANILDRNTVQSGKIKLEKRF